MQRLLAGFDISSLQRRWRDGLALLALLVCGWLLAQYAYYPARAAAFDMNALPALLPRAGLYELETFSDRPGSYRWTNGGARVDLPNPGGAAELRMVLAGGPGRAAEARIGAGRLAFAFEVHPEPRRYHFALPASSGERIRLTIDSPTFRDRRRDVGLVLSDLSIAGGGAAPARVLLAGALATIGVYMLLRRAGWSLLRSGGALLLLQGLALLWQGGEGWRYALFGALMLLAGAGGGAAVALEGWLPAREQPRDAPPRLARRERLLLIGLIALALCVRLPWLPATDPVGDLELSARRMGFLRAEGLAGAYHDDGDYMPLRLYWLRGFAALPLLGEADFRAPLPPLTLLLIKLPGLLADLATVALLYTWSRRWRSVRWAPTLAALYALAPPVWMNVAWWGQVDAILVLPILLMIVLLDRSGGRWSWACWALALLIKPQAIIFAPVLYIATVRRHGCRALALGGALAAAIVILGCAPLVLAGQGPGLLQAAVGAVGRFPQLTNRAYNLWYLVTLGASGSDTGAGLGMLSPRAIGLLLMGGVAALVGLALIARADAAGRALAAAALALAFFALPTQIHERYLFLGLALLLMRAAADPPLLLPFLVLLVSATLNILGTLRGFWEAAYLLIAPSPLPLILSAVNLLVLAIVLVRLLTTSAFAPRLAAVRSHQAG